MYRIIGGDQKEYGPVTAEHLRRWVAEGRVNAQTSVQAEGTVNGSRCPTFPAFADLLGAKPAGGRVPIAYGAPGGTAADGRFSRGDGSANRALRGAVLETW